MIKPLKFVIMTDIHYYSKKNWIAGNFEELPPENDQLLRKYSEEIIKHTFDELCEDGESDIVLISGDLTNNGERKSHEEIREALRTLKARGKRVFVTTATHDYHNDYMPAFVPDENGNQVPVPQFSRDELLDFYREFGYDTAISTHEESMSYVAQLADGYRLLALNDDHGDPHCGYTEECFEWITEQVKKARDEGQHIIAMTHHPLITPSAFYEIIGGTNLLHEREKRIEQFADMDIPFILTGHSHIHNISSVETKSGKTFYDISTSALVGYPPAYRKIEFFPDDRKIDVKTVFVDNVKGIDTNGLSLSDYIKKLFLGSIADAVENAVGDYEKFAGFAVGMSISKEVSYRYKFIIQPTAKFLSRLTFGKVWNFVRFSSGVSPEEIKPVRNKKAVPFMIDVAANLFKGDADIEKSSVEYRVAEALLKKLDKLSKPFSKKLKSMGAESISSLVLPLIHNDGLPDANAVLYY